MPTRMELGKSAINSINVAINQDLKALKPKTRIDTRYLLHAVLSRAKEIQSHGKGATVQGITIDRLHAIQIPLPPLEEQRRIAAILDKSDEILAATAHRANMLKAFPKSLYVDMFGDPKRNPLHWPLFSLGEICQNEDSKRVPVKPSDRKAMQGKYPYYGASGIIDHVDDYLFEGERLLVGEDGANLLARSSPIAFIARGKYWVNNHAHVLSENGKAKLRFLETYFCLVDLKPFVTGSAQPKLTRSALDSLSVPLPPIDLQERFDSILTRASANTSRVEASAGHARNLAKADRQIFLQTEGA